MNSNYTNAQKHLFKNLLAGVMGFAIVLPGASSFASLECENFIKGIIRTVVISNDQIRMNSNPTTDLQLRALELASQGRIQTKENEYLLVLKGPSGALELNRVDTAKRSVEVLFDNMNLPIAQRYSDRTVELSLSPDHRFLLAVDLYEIHVFDLKTKQKLETVSSHKIRGLPPSWSDHYANIKQIHFISDVSFVFAIPGILIKVNLMNPTKPMVLQLYYPVVNSMLATAMSDTKTITVLSKENSSDALNVTYVDADDLKVIKTNPIDNTLVSSDFGKITSVVNDESGKVFFIAIKRTATETGHFDTIHVLNAQFIRVASYQLPPDVMLNFQIWYDQAIAHIQDHKINFYLTQLPTAQQQASENAKASALLKASQMTGVPVVLGGDSSNSVTNQRVLTLNFNP